MKEKGILMSNNTSHYQHTLDDLELRRAKCIEELSRGREELSKIEAAITGLRAAMELNVNFKPLAETLPRIARPSDGRQRYADMSVRWAILKLLAEFGPLGQGMKSADISDALLGGGNEKASKPTVSAVISDMVNQRKELEQGEDGYLLTLNGKHAWNAIKHNAKYVNRASAGNE
jgi:hypothetical protein